MPIGSYTVEDADNGYDRMVSLLGLMLSLARSRSIRGPDPASISLHDAGYVLINVIMAQEQLQITEPRVAAVSASESACLVLELLGLMHIQTQTAAVEEYVSLRIAVTEVADAADLFEASRGPMP